MQSATPDTVLDAVPQLLAEAARELIAPRFRQLEAGDIKEKSPGEVVTIVDRDVEARLTPALEKLLRNSRVVGEEACASQPSLMDGLAAGNVWLLDPLDGTSNFIAGRPDVAVMVTLIRHGEPAASWMLHALDGTLYTAQRGGGAWRNGERVNVQPENAEADALKGIVRTRYLPPPMMERVVPRCARLAEQQPGSNCAGVDYPAIVQGESHFALYWRTLPWDHAPGTLFLREAGGHVARLDGSEYRVYDRRPGLLAASDVGAWEKARDVLGLVGE